MSGLLLFMTIRITASPDCATNSHKIGQAMMLREIGKRYMFNKLWHKFKLSTLQTRAKSAQYLVEKAGVE